jgi:RNA polymerase sigma-70 factor (ECF subfamily)
LPDSYRRLLTPLRAKARRLLGDAAAAEDVAQETLLRLFTQGTELADDPRTILAWGYRTCTRLAIDALRARRRIDPSDDLGALPCAVRLEDALAARRAIAAVGAMATEDELEAAVLCRIDGMAHTEAAGVLGVSERTVRRLLERFDERLGPMRKELTS